MKTFAVRSFRKPTLYSLLIFSFITALPFTSSAQTKGGKQVVKPPIALAYIDVATIGSDMPGANMMGAAVKGGQSGGFFGALGGLAKGTIGGAGERGNDFGHTRAMGFAMGRFVDVSVHTSKNTSLTEATQMIPSTMLLGDTLKLVAPLPDKPLPVVIDETPIEPAYDRPKGKISIYWGCSESIRPGQPRTLDVAKVSAEDFAKFFVMRGKTAKGARSQPGYPAWPNKVDDRKVPEKASLVGQHRFVGDGVPESLTLTLAAPQDLMPAIALSQVKRDGGVHLEWQMIPHTRGYFISAMGAKSGGGDGADMIIWTSSELPDVGFGLIDYQSNADVDKWIKEKVILPADVKVCDIPKGIFGEQGGGMLRMIAYGSETFFAYPPRPNDAKLAWEPDWQSKVRVKSTFSSMVGGFGEATEQKTTPRQSQDEKKRNAVDLLKDILRK